MATCRPALLCGLLTCLVACGGNAFYRLHLVFEDAATEAAVARVEVWALDPAGGTCGELWNGDIRPDDMTSHAHLVVRFDAPGDPGRLREVPAGEVIFFAEGSTDEGAAVLRGCERAHVAGGETVEVTIGLDWFCRPDPAGEMPGNGMDDDCDGLTDECVRDEDCEDGSVCTVDLCVASECHNRALQDGLSCNDGNPCTTGDACSQGQCLGTERNCTAFDGECVAGACDPVTVECKPVPLPDGTTCDDGLFCTDRDVCHAGACAGVPTECEDGDPCTADHCNEFAQDCDHVLQPRPGGEGRAGDATCANAVDDDCDGLTDDEDPNCRPCQQDADCEDGNPCTIDRCVATECENTAVADGSSCDDGLYCTVDERCENGSCASSQRDCSGVGDACHLGVCLESEDRCTSLPRADGAACEDGAHCTVGDRCVGEVCTPLGPRECNDSDFCTDDSCNENLDRCDYVLHPRPGLEGPVGDDTCHNGQDDDCDGLTDEDDGNCFECSDDSDCDDNNPCTLDTCSEAQCQAETVASGTACDDGDPCSMNDVCQGEACTGPPTDADGDSWVSDACGGTDCDDDLAGVHPGGQEGPLGEASCSDGLDNNCDGMTDGADARCWQPVCSPDGWCWENPLPQGNGLMAIWGASANDVWMAGFHGTMLHWDGTALSVVPLGTTRIIYSLWGSSASNVWAVGEEGVVRRYNGSSWTNQNIAGTSYWIYCVWGFAANDVWAGGASGKTWHFNGQGWTERSTNQTSDRILAIWGASWDDVWAAGWSGSIFRWSPGGGWAPATTGEAAFLMDIWGSGADDVWAVGDDGESGVILHWNGGAWTRVESGTTEGLFGVWGTSADNAWAVGENDTLLHWDGNIWSNVSGGAGRGVFWMSTGDLQSLWGTSAGNVWAVGHGGRILRFDGSGWTDLVPFDRSYLRAVWTWGSGEVWSAGSGGAVLRGDAATGIWEPMPAGWAGDIHALSGAGPDDILAVGGEGGLLRWNGTSWARETGPVSSELNDVWVVSTDDAWVVGDAGVILHWTGGDWVQVDSGTTANLRGVWGAPGVAVAVGDGGVETHWLGTDWSPGSSGTSEDLLDIWGDDTGSLWLVGRNGTIREWTGSGYTSRWTGDPEADFHCIWGSAANDIWVADRAGGVAHWNGSSWQTQTTGTANRLSSIWGDGSGNVWIAGPSGGILRRGP